MTKNLPNTIQYPKKTTTTKTNPVLAKLQRFYEVVDLSIKIVKATSLHTSSTVLS